MLFDLLAKAPVVVDSMMEERDRPLTFYDLYPEVDEFLAAQPCGQCGWINFDHSDMCERGIMYRKFAKEYRAVRMTHSVLEYQE